MLRQPIQSGCNFLLVFAFRLSFWLPFTRLISTFRSKDVAHCLAWVSVSALVFFTLFALHLQIPRRRKRCRAAEKQKKKTKTQIENNSKFNSINFWLINILRRPHSLCQSTDRGERDEERLRFRRGKNDSGVYATVSSFLQRFETRSKFSWRLITSACAFFPRFFSSSFTLTICSRWLAMPFCAAVVAVASTMFLVCSFVNPLDQ